MDDTQKHALKIAYDMVGENWMFIPRAGEQAHLYAPHPLASQKISEAEFMTLAADIERHRAEQQILVHAGQILDGRHRLAIAWALDLPVQAIEWAGTDSEARDYVLSQRPDRDAG